jgi:hypothetical protein
LPLSQSRSDSKAGLAETVVVAERWAGSSVTLMLELMGKMSFSSRFPQYLMTAILLGARPVLVTTHSFPSFPIAESSSHPPTHTHTHTQTGTKETSNDDHNPLRKLEEAEDKTCNDHNRVSKLTCSVRVSVQRRERSWRLLKPLLRTSACVHYDDEGTAVRLFIHQYPCTS